MASGTSVTGVDWKNGTGDTNYAAGPLTRVYIPVSAERENRLIDGILVHADQDGTLKAGAVDNAAVLADDVVETAKIKDKAVTLAKVNGGTTAGVLTTDAGGNVIAQGEWQSWTPVWTSSGTAPSIGNGTLTGVYAQIGKSVFFRIKLVGGSTTSWGSGNYTISLPVPGYAGIAANDGFALSGYAEDAGVAAYLVSSARMFDASKFYVMISRPQDTALNPWAATSPFAWGTGDYWSATGFYQAA